jgi:Zn-finger nucleic acid-binding protein
MNCPKCDGVLESVDFNSVKYEQCTACRGLWFDALEAEELSEIRFASSVDTGNLAEGEKMNKIREAICPVCSIPMRVVYDRKYPQIQLDSCSSCHGLFFDAGEFKAFCGEKDFLERIKGWRSRKG